MCVWVYVRFYLLSFYVFFIFFLIWGYPSFPYYKYKNNHPMFGKTHSESSKYLISKPGNLNPMFGKTHSDVTKQLMSIKKSIMPLGLFDENNNFIDKYSNQIELASKFGVHKTTSGFSEPSILKQVNFLKINFT